METIGTKVCAVCGGLFPESASCPVCLLRGALDPRTSGSRSSVDNSSSKSRLYFGHYRILRNDDGTPIELGRGAMGVTYKALDINLRCVVALKVISGRILGDPSARRRFVREARAAASVNHANVASVFHLGRQDDLYYYAMQFVDGEGLDRVILRTVKLEASTALSVTARVAAGLEAIAKQNLVHRDIKPSNIVVVSKGTRIVNAKIIDLGLAKNIADEELPSTISDPGSFVGTPAYASPEQFAGIEVDIRSDLYSLGVT
ncbi:MAG: serine/threonine protein kinase, partial [Verrucomicrobia bacterium]|nr:serine/threonine protein kinase [Verrucomicrobiota bacterium]